MSEEVDILEENIQEKILAKENIFSLATLTPLLKKIKQFPEKNIKIPPPPERLNTQTQKQSLFLVNHS